MAGPMLPLALQNRPEYASPYAAEMQALQARMGASYPETYSPEEQQKRVAENRRMMQLGILGQLSGDEQAGNVGGAVLKNALAAQQPHMTERGSGDPLTGRFSYNPAYRQERDQQRYDTLAGADAAARGRHDEAGQRRDEQAALALTLKGMGRGGGGAGGGVAGNTKATLEGFDPDTGFRVVADKTGTPFRIGPDGRQTLHQGLVVPKLDWEKSVTGASEALGALQSSSALLAQAQANPGAFGLTAKLFNGLPNFARGYGGALLNVSPAEQQALTKIQQAAALEIHKLYGAALSAGEDKRAQTFLPNPDDDAPILLNKLGAMRDLVQSTVNRYGPAVIGQARARSGEALQGVGQTPPGAPQAPGGPPGAAPGPAAPGLTPEQSARLAELRAWKAQQQAGR